MTTTKSDEEHLDEPFILEITINRDSPVALHQQISVPLERMITKGEILPGQTIEDEVSLANRLQISRPTVRRAFQDLVTKGLLSRRRGVGTRVSPQPGSTPGEAVKSERGPHQSRPHHPHGSPALRGAFC